MNTTLAVRPVNMTEWQIMREQAALLVKTGFLPEAIKTPEQAVAVMLKGRELNVPAMHALSNIVVIKGKPVANAELMLALVYRDHGDNAIRFTQSDEKVCTVSYRRLSWTEPESFSFTMEDAKTADLLTNQTWQKYPKAMLRARCISAVARMAFADTIGGLYTPDELGAEVDQEGQVIDLEAIAPDPEPTPKTNGAWATIWGKWTDLVAVARASGVPEGALADITPEMTRDEIAGRIDELKLAVSKAAEMGLAPEPTAEDAALPF